MTEADELIARLYGRAMYLRNRGEVKSPDLMESAAKALHAASPSRSEGVSQHAVQSEEVEALEKEITRLRTENSELASRIVAQTAMPFLCPCCGARGTTDGKASTVSSAHREAGK